MKKLIIILTIMLLPSFAFANFSVKFENTFDKKMYYLLYWIDHPNNWPQPANMAGGELNGLESRDLNVKYKSGKYLVIWRDSGKWQNEMVVEITENATIVTVTPKEVTF